MAQTQLISTPLKMIYASGFSYQAVVSLLLCLYWVFSSWPPPNLLEVLWILLPNNVSDHLFAHLHHWFLTWAQAFSIPDLHHCCSLRTGLPDSSFAHLKSPHCYKHELPRICIWSCHFFLLKILPLFSMASGLSLNSSEWLIQSFKTWAFMSLPVHSLFGNSSPGGTRLLSTS